MKVKAVYASVPNSFRVNHRFFLYQRVIFHSPFLNYFPFYTSKLKCLPEPCPCLCLSHLLACREVFQSALSGPDTAAKR